MLSIVIKIPRIKTLQTMKDFTILLEFYTGERMVLDLKPIMEEYPLFHALEENHLFESAKIDLGGFGIVWNEEFSISAGDAFERAKLIDSNSDILEDIFIAKLIEYRKGQNMTQAELADITSIPQPTIAKIEGRKSDPKLSTITKLADSLGYRLELVSKDHPRR